MDGPISRRDLIQRGAALGFAATSAGTLLGACGGDSQSAPKRASGVVTYLKNPTSADETALVNKVLPDFHRLQPNIKVVASAYDITAAETKLTTAFASNSPPDVTQMADTLWPKFAAAGALADLTDRVKDPSYASEYAKYPKEAWEKVTFNGKIYGIPFVQDGISWLWANLDLMKKAGVTDWSSSYEAMREAAKRTRKGNVYGYGMTTTMPGYAYQSWINYIYNAGGALVNKEMNGSGLDKPEVAQAFDYLRTLHHEDKVTPPPGAYDFPQLAALFHAGRLAILHLDAEVDYVTGRFNKKPIGFELEPFKLPAGPGGQVLPAYRGTLHISARSDNPEAAWEWVKYASSARGATRLIRLFGGDQNPVRTDIADAIYPPDEPRFKLQRRLAAEEAKGVRVFDPHPRTLDMIQAVQAEFEKLIRGNQTGAGLVRAASAQIDQMTVA